MYVLWILENNVESRKRCWLLDSIMYEKNNFFSSKVLSIFMFIFDICVAVNESTLHPIDLLENGK